MPFGPLWNLVENLSIWKEKEKQYEELDLQGFCVTIPLFIVSGLYLVYIEASE